jgi:hypothetical protein
MPDRQSAAEAGKDDAGNMRSHHKAFLDRWWQLSWGRADMLTQLAKLPRYLVCSRVTKRPIFAFVSSTVRPGDALQVFAFADDYSFGILQSSAHWQWFVAKCSKLTERLRYTPRIRLRHLPLAASTDREADRRHRRRRLRDTPHSHRGAADHARRTARALPHT